MKEELYKYYIIDNNTRKDTASHFGLSDNKLKYMLKTYNISKPRSLSAKNIKYDKEKAYNKRVSTSISKYGVDNPIKSEIVKNKYHNTINNRKDIDKVLLKELYKDEQLTIKEIAKELNSTINHISYLVNKYNLNKNRKEITESTSKSYMKAHGVSNPSILNSLDYKIDLKEYILNLTYKLKRKPYISEISTSLSVSYSSIYLKIKKYNLDDFINKDGSRLETIFEDFLIELKVKYIKHKRGLIDNLEVDFYLPDIRLGIEINDISSHNSTIGYYLDGTPKIRQYHQNKTIKAIENNIHLITIYEWELLDKELFNKIKNYIKKLIIKPNIIYARNCTIKEIDIKDIKDFLNKNHLQGYSNSKINIGLFYKDILMEVMTFGKPRFNKEYEYELIRLCSLDNYSIIGGASKLFKYFLDKYNPKNILSYCNIDKFNGNVYNKLGFKFIEYTEPNYIWTNYKYIIPRYKTQRNKLDKLFNKEFDKKLSESDIMESMGYLKVYDSGNAKYVYTNKSV